MAKKKKTNMIGKAQDQINRLKKQDPQAYKEYTEALKRLKRSQRKYTESNNTKITNKDKGNFSRGKVSESTKRARRKNAWNVSSRSERKASPVKTYNLNDIKENE